MISHAKLAGNFPDVEPSTVPTTTSLTRCGDGKMFKVRQTIYLRLPGPVPVSDQLSFAYEGQGHV